MRSSYELNRSRKLRVGIDKSFNIIIRLGDCLKITIEDINSLMQTCRHVFDLKYSTFSNPMHSGSLTVTPEFSSKSRLFPIAICISNKSDGQCKLDRPSFIRLMEYIPTINFKVKALHEMNFSIIFNNLKDTYVKSEYYGRGIRPFIDRYLNLIPATHACFLSEFLNAFPITMYDRLDEK